MTSPETIGRKPITIVELEQPRCVNRFGVAPCTATGLPKCYNTISTCRDLPNYAGTGSIKWRFVDERPARFSTGVFTDVDNPELEPLPILQSVSTSESQINTGSNLDGRSPFGVTGKVSIVLQDTSWNDHVGDFYVADRAGYVAGKPPPVRGPFWALWTARNLLYNDMFLRVYDGYEGQALSAMQQRLYVLASIDGPNDGGRVTLTGLDPLRLASDKRALFPSASKLDVFGDIDAVTTDVRVFGLLTDLTSVFGNTGTTQYVAAGKEILSYSGVPVTEAPGQYKLTNVVRGVLGTVAVAHADKDKMQRIGRYEDMPFWLVLDDLFKQHTTIPDTFIPLADWNTEGSTYLPTYRATKTVVKPTPVQDLAGQLMQQGLFYIWWSEYAQQIKLLAVRAPSVTPTPLSDDKNFIRGTTLTRDPRVRLTNVTIYYNQLDVFGRDDDPQNYSNSFTAIDSDNLGETRSAQIYAPWVINRTQAGQLAVRLLIRYKAVPKFLNVTIDARDRSVIIGTVVDIDTAAILDTEGNLNTTRWQVIAAKELVAGHSYVLNMQTYEFVGRFGRYMADGSPTYATATAAQLDTGGWYADATGKMSDGTEGYKYQ